MKTADKYTPKNLEDVIYPNFATRHRIKAYSCGHLEGHIMLHGPNGTGKTTVAHLLATTLGGAQASKEECDFEDFLAKPKLRDYLLNAAAFAAMTSSGKHFLILNEFDKARKGVAKLWTALDQCGDGIMAIFTTNHPMEIDRGIRSRCDLIEFPGITAAAVLPRVQTILKSESLSLPDSQILSYLKREEHAADLRKYLKVVDVLLYLNSQGLSMPPWTPATAKLSVVKR